MHHTALSLTALQLGATNNQNILLPVLCCLTVVTFDPDISRRCKCTLEISISFEDHLEAILALYVKSTYRDQTSNILLSTLKVIMQSKSAPAGSTWQHHLLHSDGKVFRLAS